MNYSNTNSIFQLGKTRARLRAVFVVFSLVVPALALAQPTARMGVSPGRYEVTFDERGGETQSLLVQNLSNEPLTVNLSVSNWTLTDNNKVAVIPPTENSLDQWVVINPLTITIPPKSPQTIRWAIMPRLKPEPGEYRAMIYIDEVLPSRGDQDDSGVRMKMRYGMPIYAQVGEKIQRAQYFGSRTEVENVQIELDVQNDGNSHARLTGHYGIWPVEKYPGDTQALSQLRTAVNRQSPAAGMILGEMPGTVVLPDNRRNIPVKMSISAPGKYVLQLDAEFGGLEITDSLTIDVPGT